MLKIHKTKYSTLKNGIYTLVTNIFFVILAILVMLPLAWLVLNSFKTNKELYADSLSLPEIWLFSNYIEAWNRGLAHYFINSIIVSVSSLICILVLSALTAYGLTRFKFKLSNMLLFIVLGGMALSEQVALVPLYKMLKTLNLYNTYFAVILPYIAFRVPFIVFLIRAYFISIPKELEEAAYIDGYNSFKIFRKIIIPISKPVLASSAIVNLNFIWNEFMFALVFLEDNKLMTIPIGLMTFKGQLRDDYTVMFAGIVIGCLPMIIVYLLMQKQFIRGLTSGAIKG
jgi:raffinose/stachyose/melibiose transport system permease protein